jgi:hypothetical protein
VTPGFGGIQARMDPAECGTQPCMLTYIIILIVVGLIAGAVARLLVPGRDPIGLLGTIVLGITGLERGRRRI